MRSVSSSNLKFYLRLLLALTFAVAGVLHFTNPQAYLRIMPPYLPYHLALVYISGFFEIAGGVGLLVRRVRRRAAIGLIVLLFAVLPANVNMALNDLPLGEMQLSPFLLLLRIPLQFVFAWLVWWCAADDRHKS